MKRKLIFALISLAVLIFIIMSVFSYDGNEEKVYEKGELVENIYEGRNTFCKTGTERGGIQ